MGRSAALAVAIEEESTEDQQNNTYEQLILEHRENGRKLARSLLRRWRVRIPAEETDSIVDLTLCEAARRYSPKFGASFMTFLFYHLRGNLVRFISSAAQTSSFMVSFSRMTGIEINDWSNFGEQELATLLPDFNISGRIHAEEPESLLLQQERVERCREAVAKLDKLEQEVISKSFADDESLVHIAKRLGYSRCHISRVKKKALEKLKNIVTEVCPELKPEKKAPKARGQKGKVISLKHEMNKRKSANQAKQTTKKRQKSSRLVANG